MINKILKHIKSYLQIKGLGLWIVFNKTLGFLAFLEKIRASGIFCAFSVFRHPILF